MKQDEKTVAFLEEHIPEMAQTAVKQADWQALASGSSVVIAVEGVIQEVFPDGTVKVVKSVAPAHLVEKGKIITIG